MIEIIKVDESRLTWDDLEVGEYFTWGACCNPARKVSDQNYVSLNEDKSLVNAVVPWGRRDDLTYVKRVSIKIEWSVDNG